jgi:hypothetical protein
MHKISFIVFVLILGIFLIPVTSQAYVTTSQTAIRLNENNVLFLITYEFGHDSLSYRLPIAAKRGEESTDAVSFDILKDGKLRTNVGKTLSAVLSKAKVEEGKYVVAKNDTEEFTLLALLTLPADRAASSTDFALAVSSLPFEISDDGETYQPNKLNESELKRYRTTAIDTKQKIGITLR